MKPTALQKIATIMGALSRDPKYLQYERSKAHPQFNTLWETVNRIRRACFKDSDPPTEPEIMAGLDGLAALCVDDFASFKRFVDRAKAELDD